MVDLYSPQDLYQLSERQQILTLAGLKYPVLCRREPYFEFSGHFQVFKDAAQPDPFHS